MKRLKIYAYIIMLVFFLAGCSAEEPSIQGTEIRVFTADDNNFEVKTYINKLLFEENEEIRIYSTVEYIGQKESITVWSGVPYFHHEISAGQVSINQIITLTILKPTTFNKGEVYTIPFSKSGGYAEDDPNAEFLKNYFSESELKLPKGEYLFTASTDFFLDKELQEQVRLKNEFTVQVN